jgi:hypothetical protein
MCRENYTCNDVSPATVNHNITKLNKSKYIKLKIGRIRSGRKRPDLNTLPGVFMPPG